LLYLLATYTTEFAKFSHTSIGKAFAVLLILFYVTLDFILGLFVCALVVFYYQTDYIESFDNMLKEDANIDEHDEKTDEHDEQIDEKTEEKTEGQIDEKTEEQNDDEDDHENFETLYCDTNNKHIISKDEFRKNYCKNGHLIHKGQIIKPEMSEFIYPIKQKSEYTKCNICDTTCDFDILNKRIDDESQLINPKNSNDLFEKVWTNMKTSTEKLQKYFDKE
jgi:hypothetical protein